MAATATLAIACATGAAMYLDARNHLSKDLKAIRAYGRAMKLLQKAIKTKRLSPYYFFEANVSKFKGAECIWSRVGCYTWNEVGTAVNQYGQWFLNQGVVPGDLVAVYLHNSPEFVFVWLGLIAIGAAPALINYNLAGKALVHSLDTSRAKLLLVDEDAVFQERIGEVMKDGSIGGMVLSVLDANLKAEIGQLSSQRLEDWRREEVKPDWPFALVYTSGTTGTPKACPFEMGRFYPMASAGATGMTWMTEKDRLYNCMPMYHGTGGVVTISQLTSGCAVCIGKRFSITNFWSDIRDSKTTWFTYVGEIARYLLAAPPSPLDKTHCVVGMYGNGLRPDVWTKFQGRFAIPEVLEFFTSTEGVLMLANHARNPLFTAAVGHQGAIMRWMTRNMYVPVQTDQTTGSIVRDSRTGFASRAPFTIGGEILVEVPSEKAFAGYIDNPEATEKKFARDVFRRGDLWYRTGDSLRRNDDGLWFFVDRLGDTFRWKGENVSTAEVQEVLGTHPGVLEANVYGVQLEGHDGKAGCAALHIDPALRSAFDYAGLLRHARKYLPRYAVPVFLRIQAVTSHSHNFKQNKVTLKEEGVNLDKMKTVDEILYVPANGDTWMPYSKEVLEKIRHGDVRL